MRIEVPAYQQEHPWTCLIACLRICLAVLDYEVSEPQLAERCGTSRLGTTFEDAVSGLEALGFEASVTTPGRLDRLLDELALGQPVIASIREGDPGGALLRHAVVVFRAEEDDIHFIDPAVGAARALPTGRFVECWLLAGGGMLVVERQ